MKKVFYSLVAVFFLIAARAQTESNNLSISFLFPTNGEVVNAPLFLRVSTIDPNATVVSVQYFAGTNSIGIVSNGPIIYSFGGSNSNILRPTIPTFYSPFMLYWDPPASNYVLTAKATDDQGNTALSDPVNVTVVPTPIVTVEATQRAASPNDPGVFTINSTGDTNTDLRVYFFLSGTAQNGTDYAAVPNSVTIPAGQTSAQVTITPLTHSPAGRTKTAILTLTEFLPPEPEPFDAVASHNELTSLIPFYPPYEIGSPSQAVVFIQSTNRNLHGPIVRITQPRNRSFFPFRTGIPITAETVDSGAYVTQVEFFDGTNEIGLAQTPDISSTGTRIPFSFTWTNAPIGMHVLTARATDSQNRSRLSPPVRIAVLPAP